MKKPNVKEQVNLVENVINVQEELNNLTVDEINRTSPKEVDNEIKLSKKELAKKEGVRYIQPSRTLMPFGKLPEHLKKQHAHDWEYIKGIFENSVINGEPIKFWFCMYPGDPDTYWEIPANVVMYIPRMIARHLSGEPDPVSQSSSMAYHTFDYVEKERPSKNDFTNRFSVVGVNYRGMFRQIGVF